MNYFLKKFIKKNYENKSDGYLFILWAIYKNADKNRKLHNEIKEELSNLDIETFDIELIKKEFQELDISFQKQEGKRNYSPIKSLQIKNFRGFGDSLNYEDKGVFIKLNKKKNIFFGPNGSGKTSFCEALEYYFTGDIKEAKRRGIKVKDYISRNGQKEYIKIEFINPELNEMDISEEEKQYFQKCFIEKNRIQEFALFGSKDTGIKEQDIMAALLGLNDLDEFVSSFAKSTSFVSNKKNEIESQIINLQSENKKYLELKTVFSNDLRKIREKIQLYFDKEEELTLDKIYKKIEQYKNSLKFYEEEIERLSNINLPELNRREIVNKFSILKEKANIYLKKRSKLIEQALNLNLEKFYSSILEIEDIYNEKCPACDTELSIVRVNPYEKAKSELIKFENLKKERELYLELENELYEEWFAWCNNLINDYYNCSKDFPELNIDYINKNIQKLKKILNGNDKKNERIDFVLKFVDEFDENINYITDFYKYYFRVKKKVDRKSETINELRRSKQEIEENLKSLEFSSFQIKDLNSKLKTIEDNINQYHKNLEKLKNKKKLEEKYNNLVKDVNESYKNFYNDLIEFRNKIEQKEIENIEDKVLAYYQDINKSDDPSEYVEKLEFVLKGSNYRINYSTKDSPAMKDAHICLSEGHLRALGLAIILAVAEKNDVPFLIFDDVVNAIDSEHRSNIIELFFKNEFLKKKQMIITTHDRLFWERFCNTFQQVHGGKNARYKISYVFNYTNKGTVIHQYNVGFEEKILQAFDNYDIRQALVYCRIWFETLATQYCVDKGETITGKFYNVIPPNLLMPTLESIYNVLDKKFSHYEFYKNIKQDLINWGGQNQEHHAFSEHGYNFVHSKTSDEVYLIFEAVREFADTIYPDKQLQYIKNSVKEYEKKYETEKKKLDNHVFLQKAASEEILKAKMNLNDCEKKLKYFKDRKEKFEE